MPVPCDPVNGRDVCARLVRLIEALEDGDTFFAIGIAEDLLREIGDAE